MRWEGLFSDLDAQISASEQLYLESEVADRARAEAAGIDFADRLRGASGSAISVLLTSQLRFEGILSQVGDGWFFLDTETRSVLVRSESVLCAGGMSRLAAQQNTVLRYTFGSVLRLFARNRELVTLHLAAADGQQTTFCGVIDRVGMDYCDLSIVRDGEVRRSRNVAGRQLVPFSAIAALTSTVRETD